MHILLLRHYPRVEFPSMRIFAHLIASGLRYRGHSVYEFTAPVVFGRLPLRVKYLAKLAGYIDQFLIFPPLLFFRAVTLPRGTLCVLADQALGPWFPWLAARPHIVHCHDLLALETTFGRQPFHRIGFTGRLYQRWILSGFRRARFFLSVSAATKAALEPHLANKPRLSAVLHNPLSPRFSEVPEDEAKFVVSAALPRLGDNRFIFHIGRNWYKNRVGLLAVWSHLHALGNKLHLVMVGALDSSLQLWLQQHPHLLGSVHVLNQASDELVVALYNTSEALLYPSHAEGFGWPVLEALACGCPVLTTNRPPMTEVGGDAASYIPPAPAPPQSLEPWAQQCARALQGVLTRNQSERNRIRQLGFQQASRFQYLSWLDQLESFYLRALALQEGRSC